MSTQLFDKAAADWDKKPLRLLLAEKVVHAIRAAVPLHRAMNVLEIGCGTGLVTISLSPLVGRIVATDTSTGMLDELKGKIRDLQIDNIEPLPADLAYAPLAPGTFELIYSSMTLHHIKDTLALLSTCHKLLAPGGFIALADLEKEDGSFHSDMTGVAHLGFVPAELVALAASSGFTMPMIHPAHVIVKHDAAGDERRYPIFLLTAQKMESENKMVS